ncbi:MAG TPA: hypothetical protein VFA77_08920, partial [Candidatus Eisenbacteria bacterium]|nr:hypothetical protein [Candidatus Eisenbacteria bacterium]
DQLGAGHKRTLPPERRIHAAGLTAAICRINAAFNPSWRLRSGAVCGCARRGRSTRLCVAPPEAG